MYVLVYVLDVSLNWPHQWWRTQVWNVKCKILRNLLVL